MLKLSFVWKMGVAAGISWDMASLLGPNPPYFAPLAVVLTMQETVEDSIWLGYQRVLGIIIGIFLAEWSSHTVGIHGWSIGLLVVAGTLVARLLRLGKQAVTQVSVSALLVWIVGVSHPGYALDRVRDTIVGVLTGIACNMFILPPDFTPAANQALQKATHRLAERFEVTSAWMMDGLTGHRGDILEKENNEYLPLLHDAKKQLDEAVRALNYSPLVKKRRRRLAEYDTDIARLQFGYEQLSLMCKTVMDWKNSSNFDLVACREWGKRMGDIGRLLRRFAEVQFTSERDDGSIPSPRVKLPPLLDDSYEVALANQFRQFEREFVPNTRANNGELH